MRAVPQYQRNYDNKWWRDRHKSRFEFKSYNLVIKGSSKTKRGSPLWVKTLKGGTPTLTMNEEAMALKKGSLRFNEYYDIQNVYDDLYKESQRGKDFKELFEIITSRENILVAYRKIKSNKRKSNCGL